MLKQACIYFMFPCIFAVSIVKEQPSC